jgi:hypothetical protein
VEVIGKGTFDVLADADPSGDVNGAFRPCPQVTVDANVRFG